MNARNLLSRPVVLLSAALALAGLIGLLDFWTGRALSMTILYLAPVALAGWFGGWRICLAAAAVCAGVKLAAAWATDWSDPTRAVSAYVHIWNAAVRLGAFLIVGLLVVEDFAAVLILAAVSGLVSTGTITADEVRDRPLKILFVQPFHGRIGVDRMELVVGGNGSEIMSIRIADGLEVLRPAKRHRKAPMNHLVVVQPFVGMQQDLTRPPHFVLQIEVHGLRS